MRVVETFVTSADPEIVWEILADVEHWREWTPTVLSVEPLGSGEFGTGARYKLVQPGLRPAIYEITECVPEARFTWVHRFRGGAMIADHRIRRHPGGTEVELSFGSEGLIGNVVGRVFSRTIRSYIATEAGSLRKRSDSVAHSATAI